MNALSRLALVIDTLNDWVGRSVRWLVLLAVLISAANAVARYGFSLSSNAWLEIQWYLFAFVFLLAAGYTLKHDGHVRVDLFYSRLSPRTRDWIDLAGGLVFLLPMAGLIAWLGWASFIEAWNLGERSADAGGLVRWPARLAIPLGFSLLALQGVAEIIHRVERLRGLVAESAPGPSARSDA